MIREGKASPPWETKYAGPLKGTGRIGVLALAYPTIDAAGQFAGFASNVAARHPFCSVARREGSCLGSSTLTFAMFAWVPCGVLGKLSFTVRLAPFFRGVCPDVETLNCRPKLRLEQSAA